MEQPEKTAAFVAGSWEETAGVLSSVELTGPTAGLINLDTEGDLGAGSSVQTLGVQASVLILWPHGLRLGVGRSGLWGSLLLSLGSGQGVGSPGSPPVCGCGLGQGVIRV